jgi:glutamate---methylamine ligase
MMLRLTLGADLVDSHVKLRLAEWNDYMRRLTDWERNHTLDV